MTPNDIIAVRGVDADTAGAVVWWALSGEIQRDALATALTNEGIHDAPPLPEPTELELLKRAITAAAYDKHTRTRRMVRPLQGRGYAIVDEVPTGDDLEYRILARGYLVAGGLVTSGLDATLCSKIEEEHIRQAGILTPTDVGAWLLNVAGACKAVGLRQNGGIYFVPQGQPINWWRAIANLLNRPHVSAHRIYEIAALRTDEAVQAILDAVVAEATSEISVIEGELGEIGKRAAATRKVRAERMRAKVSSYEQLLDAKLPALHERLESLQAALAVVELGEMDELLEAAAV